MTNRTTIQVTLALIGIALYGAGMRLGDDRLHWAGIAFVAAAVLLRFWKDRTPGDGA